MKKIINSPEAVNALIADFSRTTEGMYNLEEFRKLLLSGKQLRMKYGVDVTAPQMHIGHAVNLWMYRRLQEMGHKLVFLIGDFTTQIGDPTGKNKTRPIISPDEIKKNAEAFIEQTGKIIDTNPDVFEIRRNSEWFNPMPAKDFISLLQLITHDRLVSRDMFRKRLAEKKEIYMHEMIYPIIQGYDSVALEADITIIGNDQLYNEMLGRFYQEKFNKTPQVVITTKITPGIDGKDKQSKSIGNYIGLEHAPREKFGRTMSIPDNLIIQYLEVYTDVSDKDIKLAKAEIKTEPMKWKELLAREIVARYHGKDAAAEEQAWFKSTFGNREIPADAPKITFKESSIDALSLVKTCLPQNSNTEIKKLFIQNAVKINDEVVSDITQKIELSKKEIPVKIGKRNWFLVSQA